MGSRKTELAFWLSFEKIFYYQQKIPMKKSYLGKNSLKSVQILLTFGKSSERQHGSQADKFSQILVTTYRHKSGVRDEAGKLHVLLAVSPLNNEGNNN